MSMLLSISLGSNKKFYKRNISFRPDLHNAYKKDLRSWIERGFSVMNCFCFTSLLIL